MSFIDTIALPLFIFIIGVLALVFVGGYIYKVVQEARARSLAAKRDLRLEKQAFEFIESMFIETSSSDDLSQALPSTLHEELWKLHDRIDQNKELTRR